VEVSFSIPFEKQREFLKPMGVRYYNQLPGWDGINIGHFVSGRGGGKTHAAMLMMIWSCLLGNPGRYHLWTEATNQDCRDIFLPTLQRVIPPRYGLYTVRLNPIDVTWVTGAVTHVRSRQITNSNSEPFRGPEYCGAVHDELAKDRNDSIWNIALPVVRDTTSRRKWIMTSTTPKLGWYKDLALTDGHVYVHSTSWDNPHSDKSGIAMLRDKYDERFYEQEVMAGWVSIGDMAWDTWKDEQWPKGNLHWHRYNPHMPFIVACDFGVRSAWLILQQVPATDEYGHQVDDKPLYVAVGEYTPNNEGTQQTLQRINADYGRPAAVFCGADLTTRSVADSEMSSIVAFRSIGWNCPITPVTGLNASKDQQYNSCRGMILNTDGRRRFCVSQHLQSHDETKRNKRGILHVMHNDAFSQIPRQGEFLPKDKNTGNGYEDMRDAFMYGMVELNQPMAYRRKTLAA